MTIFIDIAQASGSECKVGDYLRDSDVTAFGADFINLSFPDPVLGQNIHLVLQGTGLSYNGDITVGDGEVTSGTITAITITLDDDTTVVANIGNLTSTR
jgi:hypothetical protein